MKESTRLPEGALSGEEDIGGVLPRALGVRDGKSRHDQARDQSGDGRRAKRERLQPQSQPPDARAEQGRGQADDDRPPQLRYGRRAEMRQARDGQGEGAQPGPGVQPEEDERADARGQQAGHQDEAQHRSAQPGRLHQQERADDRRTKQRADGGEASRRGEDGRGLVGYVTSGGPQGQHDQAAADGDQGRLGSEHGAEDQGGQGGEYDAGQFGWRRGAVRLEALRREGATGAWQVPDGQAGQHAAHRQHGQRPPYWLSLEAQAMRKMGEDLRLEVVDQREEAVGGGGDRHPEHRRDEQQPEVTAAAQERARIRGHRHSSIVSGAGREWLTYRGCRYLSSPRRAHNRYPRESLL